MLTCRDCPSHFVNRGYLVRLRAARAWSSHAGRSAFCDCPCDPKIDIPSAEAPHRTPLTLYDALATISEFGWVAKVLPGLGFCFEPVERPSRGFHRASPNTSDS